MLVFRLGESYPLLIGQVQSLVLELWRITLLWDELWLGVLNQHHPDVTKRIEQLDDEIKKVAANKDLTPEEKEAIIEEKHHTILKPTLYAMLKLHTITGKQGETAHHYW